MSLRISGVGIFCLSLILVLVCKVGSGVQKTKLSPEELIARHLEALGSAQSRSRRTSCQLLGASELEIVAGGTGRLPGRATLITSGRRFRMTIAFGVNEYPAEDLAFSGERVAVGFIQPGVRSALGHFLFRFEEILSEGLLGGVLSTSWSLLDTTVHTPKLKYEGLKKIDGAEFHTLKYERRKGGNVETRLYFDPETDRHSYSIYKVQIGASIVAGNPNASASQEEMRYILKEGFSDFREVDGLTLPSRWMIEFTTEQGRAGSVLRFRTAFDAIDLNANLRPEQFVID